MYPCMRLLREEFQPRKLGFSDIHPGRFCTFQWPLPAWLHVIYRVALAAYVDGWLSYSLVVHSEHMGGGGLPWTVFLTNWSYFLLAIYQTLHAIITIGHHLYLCSKGRSSCRMPDHVRHRRLFPEIQESVPEEYQPLSGDSEMEGVRMPIPEMPWYLSVAGVLFSAVSSSCIIVTSIFYIFLLPEISGGEAFSMGNLQFHFLNSMIMILENLTTALPIRLLHVVYPMAYLSIYLLFSVFYWIPDHRHTMYPNVLDWNYPGKTMGMVLLVGFVILPILQCIFYCVYRAKCAILSRCN